MKKILIGCMAIAWFNVAQASVINFDDLTTNSSFTGISNGYNGFNWTNNNSEISVVASNSSFLSNFGTSINLGWTNGTVSGPNVATGPLFDSFISSIELVGSGTFDFNSAYFTSFVRQQNLRFEGYNNGSLLYSSANYAINDLTPLLVSLNWAGIDSLRLINDATLRTGEDGGIVIPWVMDDFTYNQTPDVNAVPLPAAVWLFGSGLVGFVGFRKKSMA